MATRKKNDGRIRFARVPSGGETCPFCLMLASRGFVYTSAEAAWKDHFHSNCDCQIVPGYADAVIDGYDPSDIYRKWKALSSRSGKEPHLFTGSTYSRRANLAKALYVQTEIDMPDGKGGSLGKRQCDVYETSDGTRFVFPSEMSLSEQSMLPDRAIALWSYVPDGVKRYAQRDIVFVDYENPMDSYWRKKYKRFSRSYATGGDSITFYKSSSHDDGYVVRTYCHEIGHHIDMELGLVSDSEDWVEAMSGDYRTSKRKSVTDYGSNSPKEDFAESVAEYCIDKTSFKAHYKRRFEILERIIGGGT